MLSPPPFHKSKKSFPLPRSIPIARKALPIYSVHSTLFNSVKPTTKIQENPSKNSKMAAYIVNILMFGILLGTITVRAQHESTPASTEKGSGMASSAQTPPSSGESSSSSSPSSLPSQPPHPPASEPTPSEQKVSSLSVEKEKPEENSDTALNKDVSSNAGKLASGASSAEAGHSSSSELPSSTPSSNGVTGITIGWVGPSLLAFVFCILLA